MGWLDGWLVGFLKEKEWQKRKYERRAEKSSNGKIRHNIIKHIVLEIFLPLRLYFKGRKVYISCRCSIVYVPLPFLLLVKNLCIQTNPGLIRSQSPGLCLIMLNRELKKVSFSLLIKENCQTHTLRGYH